MSSETRQVSDFSKIELLGAGEIHLKQANSFELIIEAEDTVLPLIRSEVRGQSLVLEFDKDSHFTTNEPIHYYITMPRLEVLHIAGGGKVYADTLAGNSLLIDVPGAANLEIGRIAVNAFQLDVKGSVKMQLAQLQAQGVGFDVNGTLHLRLDNLQADALTSSIEGTCNVDMAGQVTAQIIHAPGVINYKAGELGSSQVTVNAKGMANITLWVEDILTVRLEGVGNIRYYGKPERSIKINGMASVKHLGEKARTIAVF